MGSYARPEHPMMQGSPKWLENGAKCPTARQSHLCPQVVKRGPWGEAFVLEPSDDDSRCDVDGLRKASHGSILPCLRHRRSQHLHAPIRAGPGQFDLPRAASLEIGNGLAYSVAADAACASTSRARNRR